MNQTWIWGLIWVLLRGLKAAVLLARLWVWNSGLNGWSKAISCCVNAFWGTSGLLWYECLKVIKKLFSKSQLLPIVLLNWETNIPGTCIEDFKIFYLSIGNHIWLASVTLQSHPVYNSLLQFDRTICPSYSIAGEQAIKMTHGVYTYKGAIKSAEPRASNIFIAAWWLLCVPIRRRLPSNQFCPTIPCSIRFAWKIIPLIRM